MNNSKVSCQVSPLIVPDQWYPILSSHNFVSDNQPEYSLVQTQIEYISQGSDMDGTRCTQTESTNGLGLNQCTTFLGACYKKLKKGPTRTENLLEPKEIKHR
jgi:hypothetical protein